MPEATDVGEGSALSREEADASERLSKRISAADQLRLDRYTAAFVRVE